jgi:hypothetical protein
MENKLVTIATFPDALKARIVKGRLEAEGILCFIADEHTITNQPYLTMIHGGVRLQVQENDLARAEEIIRITQRPLAPIEYVPIPVTEKCPNCNSRKIEDVTSGKKQSFLTTLRNLVTSRSVNEVAVRRFTCQTCGHNWIV